MQQDLLPPFSLLIITSLAFIHIPKSFCQDQQYVTCGESFQCGNFSVGYPFWGGNRPSSCGYPGFNLSCQSNVTFLAFLPLKYRVLAVDGLRQSVTLARDDLWGGLCSIVNRNTSFNSSIFSYSSGYQNLTLSYGCTSIAPNASRILNQTNCTANSTASRLSIKPTDVKCNTTILVPVNQKATQNLGSSAALKVALNNGFSLQWKADNRTCELCNQSGGRCGYNSNTSSFVCYCSDRPYDLTCNSTKSGNGTLPAAPRGRSHWKTLALGISFGTIGLILSVASMYYLVKKFSSIERMIWSKPDKENNRHVEAFIRNCGSIAPKRYCFSEIKRMTDSFAHRLGQGGYGFVYKGKLPDGREVAVKVLRDNKGNGDEFMNEVASISRTSHVNVVSLLGFCYKANKRALVYEFMSNGSLDKFICKGESQDADCRLEWKVLYKIAVGTARGLEYLHQGCNTRIVHFDIKPQNILLDKDFCPKISDFGLAKLCKKKESVLSTMGARGTAGYIAPEVFFRGLGGMSHKSDVYSYGMMVLEMVGLNSKIQVETEKISGTYLPNGIYERLELEQDLGFEGVMNAEDEEAARKMLLVGLWCIQTKPSDRPSTSNVVEMLEGSIQSLQIPPKPNLLDSPAAVRSFQESSAASLSEASLP